MIDQATIQQIIDAADIVDVVSDFVTLKRRGSNWVGLCPFHNDRNPSFYVSRARGICKCFSCGEGGSAINFIMKHEQLTYPEALRYLARKYHIEIQEKELTDEQRQQQSQRESMLMLNKWACQYFEQQLHETQEGEEIGMSYFRERGFNEATIREFHLGYSPSTRDQMYRAAIQQGYNRELLFSTGLCIEDDHGDGYDRFRGRVIFPIFNLSGQVIAFGGRTLRQGDKTAKYVNSPESIVYNKRDILYGIYQAKKEITHQDKCYIVEGYADVISMHQAGFKNVVASSGTALTDGHIRVIRRFTSNVTEMFDGDAAGVHAAMRGVDMLLSEGLNIKVLLLPDNHDPDSFVRSRNATEVKEFIDHNETDFISFKSHILLGDAQDDPIKRATAINEVVKSISLIPSEISRSVYVQQCSRLFGVGENVLFRAIKRQLASNHVRHNTPTPNQPPKSIVDSEKTIDDNSIVTTQELAIIRLIIKYGMCYMCNVQDANGNLRPVSVIEYLQGELSLDDIQFSHPLYAQIFDMAVNRLSDFYQDLDNFTHQIETQTQLNTQEEVAQFENKIANEGGMDSQAIIEALQHNQEQAKARVSAIVHDKVLQWRTQYLQHWFCSLPQDDIRQLACQLAADSWQLSKIHAQQATIVTERDRLADIVPQAIFGWKNALLTKRIDHLQQQLANASPQQQDSILQQLQQCLTIRSQLATYMGERVIMP